MQNDNTFGILAIMNIWLAPIYKIWAMPKFTLK